MSEDSKISFLKRYSFEYSSINLLNSFYIIFRYKTNFLIYIFLWKCYNFYNKNKQFYGFYTENRSLFLQQIKIILAKGLLLWLAIKL